MLSDAELVGIASDTCGADVEVAGGSAENIAAVLDVCDELGDCG